MIELANATRTDGLEKTVKTKKVNRYYCDFCKKSGCSAPHMHRHERRCTMNPNRECGVCGLMEEEQQPIASLLKVLPNIDDFPLLEDESGILVLAQAFYDTARAAIPRLREVANDCPACILAALRQAGVPVPAIDDFDFTMEMKRVWADINDTQRE